MSSRIVSVACSTVSLVAIAIDRYYAIAHPLRRRVRHTSNRKNWVVVVIWLLSLLICIPPMSSYKLITMANGDAYCTAVWMSNSLGKTYILVGFVLTFVLPLLVMTVLYVIVGLKLRTRNLPGYTNQAFQERALQTSRHVIKMVLSIVISFAVCMLPIQLYLLVRFLKIDVMSSSGLFWGLTVTVLISNFNAFINPCLYAIFNEKFRRGFKKVLCCDQDAVLYSTSAESKAMAILQPQCHTAATIKFDKLEQKEHVAEKTEKKMSGRKNGHLRTSRRLVTLTAVKPLEML